MSVLVDTGVLIDALRQLPEALTFLEKLDAAPYASEVTRVELIQGLRSHERHDAEALMAGLRWTPVDESVARRAGQLGRQWRRSHSGVGVADLVIAATAELCGLPLATTNVRHFPMFEQLRRPY